MAKEPRQSSNRNTSGAPVDQGMIARAASRVGAVIAAAWNEAWMGPGVPMAPQAPKGTTVRTSDYGLTFNQLMSARSEEPITFKEMRFIADTLDLVRLAIETRKDQLSKIPHEFRAKVKPGTSKTKASEENQNNAHVKELTEFFKRPDGEHSWDTWCRMIMEDLLVVDAPTLYPVRSKGGQLLNFRVIDGTTITRKITPEGITPLPPDPAYQQIVKGIPAVDLTTEQLIYMPRNVRPHKFYGMSPVEQIIFMANLALRRQFSKMAYYTDGTLPQAIVPVGEDFSADQIEEIQAKFDTNAGDMAALRKLTFVPKLGGNIQFFKEALLKDDFDEWIARVIMYCFSLPPTAFAKQMNRATSEQAQEAAVEEGLTPIMDWFADLINFIIEKFFKFQDVEFVWRNERIVDTKVQADIDGIYVDKGIVTRKEVRDRLGLDEEQGAERLTVTTASGITPVDNAIENSDNPPEPPPVAAGGLPGKPGAPGAPGAGPKPGKGPTKPPSPKAAKRNERAAQLMEIHEDLNPELRDPVIVAKLAELESADGGA